VAVAALCFALVSGKLVELASLPGGASLTPAVGRLVLLSLPQALVYSLPIAAAAATLLAFATMGRRGELVAAGAAGASHWTLLWPALAGAVLISAATTFDAVVLVPQARFATRELLLTEGKRDPTLLFAPGEPINAFPGSTIIIGGRRGSRLLRVVIFERGDGGSASLRANEATVSYDSKAKTVLLDMQDCVEILPNPDDPAKTTEVRLERLGITLDASQLGEVTVRRHTKDLAPSALLARAEGEAKAAYELHRRLSLGLAPLAFVALAAPLALRLKSRSRGAGVGAAALIFLAYYAGAMAAEAAFERGGAPSWIPWLPSVGIAAAGAVACFLGARR
ncbi:MAG TPA: LptF/LptG family permease, partial [Alphaproteobacteria bacterium]|nr:LptF/LptG family permease [Alphaproteobacteria bacterium]